MVDIVSKTVRSRMMSGIRGKDTRPEIVVRQFLHSHGFRYLLHDRRYPGIPDIVMPKYNLIIFVHGCFWHRHYGCRLTTHPDDGTGKWAKKFSDTVERDRKITARLKETNWRIFVLWECGLTKLKNGTDLLWLIDAIRDPEVKSLNWPSPQVHQSNLQVR